MNLLLDTHAMLWFWLDDPRMSQPAREAIRRSRDVFISPASYWELAIKISIGKITLPVDYETFLQDRLKRDQVRTIHIEPRHTGVLLSLPFHHRDPFDRLLVAQCMVEDMQLVSSDSLLDAYPIRRLW